MASSVRMSANVKGGSSVLDCHSTSLALSSSAYCSWIVLTLCLLSMRRSSAGPWRCREVRGYFPSLGGQTCYEDGGIGKELLHGSCYRLWIRWVSILFGSVVGSERKPLVT